MRDLEEDDIWTIEYIRTHHSYIVFELTDLPNIGRIKSAGSKASGFIEEDKAKGIRIEIVRVAPDIYTHYYDIAGRRVMPKLELNDVILEGNFLKNLPPAAVITVEGQKYTAENDDSVELEFDVSGTFQVQIESPIHLPKTFEVVYEKNSTQARLYTRPSYGISAGD